jgi:uncharacterized protein DUF4410
MNNAYKLNRLGIALAVLLFASCGTTSNLQGPQGTMASARRFSKVTVQDFKVAVSEHHDEAVSSRVTFPDLIAAEIKKTGRFATVLRNARPDADTLVIDGVVTRYEEGSVSKRIFLGMGFGMALVEGDVTFRDGKGANLGRIRVDKNSWPLGGAIAAGQNPHTLMNGAADKIAEEAAKLAK